jgi:hypothetical protein
MAEPPADLAGCRADEALLDAEPEQLPADIGRPETMPPGRARARLVGVGVALTGGTLLGGIALAVLGVIELVSGSAGLGAAGLALGVAMVGTHWGWVHVAEATADGIERRREGELRTRRERWLAAVEPYARYEVSTRTAPDGSIEIVRVCHRPVRHGRGRFRFERTIDRRELHSADAPGAVVVERAEQLRREAALDTERERRRYEELHSAERAALLAAGDERDRQTARRAASAALSEQINANLREPPLEG